MPKTTKDRDANAGLDALYTSDEFRMYCFKVLPCSKHYSHDWTVCPFSHPGEKARRRDPRVFRYAGVECPHVKEGLKCPRGDLCPFAHNIFECWLHPTRYRTQLCNEPASCRRKVCFFAHTLEELREPSNPLDAMAKVGGRPSRVSLDNGLTAPFNVLSTAAHARRSLDVPGSPQLAATRLQVSGADSTAQLPGGVPGALSLLSQATGTNVSVSDLTTMLQQLTLPVASQQIPQNERISQILLMLLGEIANAGQSADGKTMDGAAGIAGAPLPRASIDNHALARGPGLGVNLTGSSGLQWPAERTGLMSSQASIPEHNAVKGQLGQMALDTLVRPSNSGVHTRGPSIDAAGAVAVSEAIAMGFQGVGRVSVDGSLLAGVRSRHAGKAAPGVLRSNLFDAARVAPGVTFNVINGDGTLRSSSDSMESDDTQMRRQSTDANLPDAFILH